MAKPSRNKTPDLKWLFFSRQGRIARYSYFLSCVFLLTILVLVLWQIIKTDENENMFAIWGLVLLCAGLFSTYCLFNVTVKRLNDLSLPWYFVFGIFIPTINYIFIGFMMFLPSKDETNEHGPPPFGKV